MSEAQQCKRFIWFWKKHMNSRVVQEIQARAMYSVCSEMA
jgi:hypothetical protein